MRGRADPRYTRGNERVQRGNGRLGARLANLRDGSCSTSLRSACSWQGESSGAWEGWALSARGAALHPVAVAATGCEAW